MARDFFGNLPIVSGMAFTRDILLLDDCEGTCNYVITGTGGDDIHDYATVAAMTGEKGLRLKTRTTTATENDWLQATRFLAYPESGLLIARVKLAVPTLSGVKTIIFALSANANANTYLGALQWTIATGALGYLNSGNTYTAIAALANIPYATAFVSLELALDLRTMTYLYARANGLTADLSGLAPYDGGAEAFRYTAIALKITASAGPPAEIYADNLYVGGYLEA